MKILKNVLAWLDWSTYATNGSYSFPKSLCPLFWRSLFATLFIPFLWISHLWNLLAIKMSDFRDEYVPSKKMHGGHGALIHFGLMFLGMIFEKKFIEADWGMNFLSITDPGLFFYAKLILLGLCAGLVMALGLGTIILVIGGTIELYQFIARKADRSTKPTIEHIYDDNGDYVETIEHEPSGLFYQIKRGYRALKDNYCPRIDWTDVKKR